MMTPVREFLYFLVILVVFGILLFFRGKSSHKTAEMPAAEIVVDSVKGNEPVAEPIGQAPIIAETARSPLCKETVLSHPTPIHFASNDSVRFRYLEEKLRQVHQGGLPVRIIYFGDSQIENDRITSTLRNKLQNRYGGSGPGFIPLDQYYNTAHKLIMEVSKSWVVKAFRDTSFINQSLLFKNAILTANDPQGWFRIRRIKSHSALPDYQLTKLYYWATDSCQITAKQGRDTVYSGYLLPENKVSTLDFQFNQTPGDIRFDFRAKDTLNICGLSLESKSGVMVDNVSLRGQAYPLFEWSDKAKITQMLDQVNVGLFILHYGVNLVPYASKDYHYFQLHFSRQIAFLKQVRPEVPILIVGVSDMAEREDGHFVSFPNIPEIKAIEKGIAIENHVAFWDLDAFMGGAGSMVNWVDAKPPLARTDYTHFTKEGAALVGNELGKLILNEMKNESLARP